MEIFNQFESIWGHWWLVEDHFVKSRRDRRPPVNDRVKDGKHQTCKLEVCHYHNLHCQ